MCAVSVSAAGGAPVLDCGRDGARWHDGAFAAGRRRQTNPRCGRRVRGGDRMVFRLRRTVPGPSGGAGRKRAYLRDGADRLPGRDRRRRTVRREDGRTAGRSDVLRRGGAAGTGAGKPCGRPGHELQCRLPRRGGKQLLHLQGHLPSPVWQGGDSCRWRGKRWQLALSAGALVPLDAGERR